MAKYDTAKLRNLGIIAHGGAGKTSLAEAILFDAGRIDRLGRVDDGTSTMDYEPEEIKAEDIHHLFSGPLRMERPFHPHRRHPRLRQLHRRYPRLHAGPRLRRRHPFRHFRGQGPDRGDLAVGQRVRDSAHRLRQQDGPGAGQFLPRHRRHGKGARRPGGRHPDPARRRGEFRRGHRPGEDEGLPLRQGPLRQVHRERDSGRIPGRGPAPAGTDGGDGGRGL